MPNNFINSEDADDEIFDSKNYTKINQNTNDVIKEDKEDKTKEKKIEEEKSANCLEDINSYSLDNIDKKMLNEMTVSSLSNIELLKNKIDIDKENKKKEKEENFNNNNKEESKSNKIEEKNNNISSIRNQKNISKKIQKLIEKDKKKYNDFYEFYEKQNGNNISIEDKKSFEKISSDNDNKSNYKSNDNKSNDNKSNDNKSLDNKISDSKSSDSSSDTNIKSEKKSENKNSIEISPINSKQNIPVNFNPMQQYYISQYLSLKLNNQNYNNYNIKLNIQKNDMSIMSEIYNNAKMLSLEKNMLNENILDSQINGNGLGFKENYMFKFEITPLKEEENNKQIKIELGIKLKYINIQDINLIIDEQLMDKQNINFKIGSLYDSLKIKKKLLICKRTGIIYVLISINKGKFFITGKEELEKRKLNIFLNKANTETFFIKNFTPIPVSCLKNIQPIFKYNKNDLKYFEIKINDKILK